MNTSHASLFAPDLAGRLSLAEATQFSERGIVSRALIATATLRVTLFGFAAGQELTEHASPARAIVQVLSGVAHWTVAGEPMILRAGDVLHMPPRAPHAVRAEEPFSMLLTLVREPAGVAPADARASRSTPDPGEHES